MGRFEAGERRSVFFFVFCFFNDLNRDFLGSPVVKIPHLQCRGCGFDPLLRN